LFSGSLLQSASVAAMLDGVVVNGKHDCFVTPGYGLGLMVDLASPAGRVAGHGGGGPGYATAAFQFPDLARRRLTSVALVNRDGDNVGLRIAFALAEGYAG
jgi:D-alanyl-D-alanine carboxypeptidase